MNSARRMSAAIATLALVTLAAPATVSAQDYPSHSITVVVPFPAGGPSDVVGRIVTGQMGKVLGQTLIIENIGGAGGTIGTGPAMNDLIGGHVDFFCEQSVSVTQQVKSGAVKAYAVSAAERLPSLPDVPTAKEFGIDYQMSIWAGIFAPKGTPAPVVAKLANALDKSLDDPGVQQRIKTLGGSIPGKAVCKPAALDRYVKAEIARWAPILTAAVGPAK